MTELLLCNATDELDCFYIIIAMMDDIDPPLPLCNCCRWHGISTDTVVAFLSLLAIVVGIFTLVATACIAAAAVAGFGAADLLAAAPYVSSGRRHRSIFTSAVVVIFVDRSHSYIAYQVAEIQVPSHVVQNCAVHPV